MKKFLGWTIILLVMFMGIQSMRSRAGHPLLQTVEVPVAHDHYTYLSDKLLIDRFQKVGVHIQGQPRAYLYELQLARVRGAVEIRCPGMTNDTLFGYRSINIEQDDHSYEIKESNNGDHIMFVPFKCIIQRLW